MKLRRECRYAVMGLLASLFFAVSGTKAVLAEPVFGVTSDNKLVRFDTSDPSTIVSSVSISGLDPTPTTSVKAIDFRPSTGKLYAMQGRANVGSGVFSFTISTIDLVTGVATELDSSGTSFGPPGNGNFYGFDFDPVAEDIRIVSSIDENIRVNPDTGVVSSDTALSYVAGDSSFGQDPNIACLAYDSNEAGSSSASLFGFDTDLNTLIRVGDSGGAPTSANTGKLNTLGALGTDLSKCGLDISSLSGQAYAYGLTSGNESKLYLVGIGGTLNELGGIGDSLVLSDIALPIAESVVPTVQVSKPRRARVRTKKRRYTFEGTGSDNTLIDEVLYRRVRSDSSTFDSAEGTEEWTYTARLKRGANRFQIKAVDVFGNESELANIKIVRRPRR